MRSGCREHQTEDTAGSGVGVHAQVATVRFGHRPRDKQPLSEAAWVDQPARGGARFAPVKALEDMRQVLVGNANARVLDLNARSVVLLTAGAMECLERYSWPGNVRELGNLIERLSITCGGRPVGVADLPPRYRPADWEPSADSGRIAGIFAAAEPPPAVEPVAPLVPAADEHQTRMSEREVLLMLEDPAVASGAILPPGGIDLRAHVSGIEESLIRQALERSHGVVAQAARLLGLRRTTLVEKLRKFGIGGVDVATAD